MPGVALWALVAAAAVLVVIACITVMRQRILDYDEIEHAHAVWLTARGDIPFHDFFECHPPFAWLALAPFARGATDAAALALRLRAIAAVGHVLTVILLCANMRLGRRDIHPLWIAVAMLTMLTSEGNLDYFAELRPDSWSNAALLGALLLARTKRYVAFGFLAVASQLWSPKLVALLAIFVVVELLRIARESRRDAIRAAAWMLGGAAAAIALALLALRAADIDPALAYTLIIRYHALLARHGGFGFGLAQTLYDQRMVSGPAVAGMILWLVAIVRRELRPNTFEMAVALFLAAELLLVPFPYKQYFAPWLLLAAVFIPFWSTLADRSRPLRVIALPVATIAVLLAAVFALMQARYTHGFARTGAYWRLLDGGRPARSGGRAGSPPSVVTPVPDHPITARDALYAWVGTTGANRGYGPEAILRELQVPGVSERFTYAHYLRELDAARPQVIVMPEEPDPAFPLREAAIADYLRRHAGEYERQVADRRIVFVRRSLARISLSPSP